MSEVPKSDTGIHATADATNPFAPIDYTSRLKTPSRHTGTFHAMQPLQPGQLYGTAHWMSPPKPLSPRRRAKNCRLRRDFLLFRLLSLPIRTGRRLNRPWKMSLPHPPSPIFRPI